MQWYPTLVQNSLKFCLFGLAFTKSWELLTHRGDNISTPQEVSRGPSWRKVSLGWKVREFWVHGLNMGCLWGKDNTHDYGTEKTLHEICLDLRMLVCIKFSTGLLDKPKERTRELYLSTVFHWNLAPSYVSFVMDFYYQLLNWCPCTFIIVN